MAKKVLVVSYGPPPVPGINAVEGGGLRCWGLSRGLKLADPSLVRSRDSLTDETGGSSAAMDTRYTRLTSAGSESHATMNENNDLVSH